MIKDLKMKKLRNNPFVWPSWISKLVAGEDQCEWKYFFKSHYQYDKMPSDFSLAKWTIQHNQLLHNRRDELEELGYTVFIEDQNSFKITMQIKTEDEPIDIIISGKADIVATNEINWVVEDAKTGTPKTSDHVQVMLYMMWLPLGLEKYKDVKFEGRIVYKSKHSNISIPAEAAQDESLKQIIWKTIKIVAGEEKNCRKVPSRNECKRCDIGSEFCKERVGEEK